MTMKIPTPKTLICSGIVAYCLLLPIVSATARTTATPAARAASSVKEPSTQTHLASNAPATTTASAAGEDIRDIRQPKHLLSHWFWTVIVFGIVALAITEILIWRWVRHGKYFVMQPHEIAFQYLDEARRLIDPKHAREYCFAVSKVIRRYIEERFDIHAPQLTTEEFLRDLAQASGSQEALLASHRELLGDFLRHCDLAKFAGWYYCLPDLEAMHLSAVEFVRRSSTGEPATNKILKTTRSGITINNAPRSTGERVKSN